MQEKTGKFYFSQNALNERNKVIIERDINFLEKTLMAFEKLATSQSVDYVQKMQELEDLKQQYQEIIKSEYVITIGDLILINIVKTNSSDQIKTIKFISFLQSELNKDLHFMDLTTNQIEDLRKLVLESKMLSIFKQQIFNELDKTLLEILQGE